MSGELFEAPFNLAGESQSSELTSEGEARVRALAESEARKAQTLLDETWLNANGMTSVNPRPRKAKPIRWH